MLISTPPEQWVTQDESSISAANEDQAAGQRELIGTRLEKLQLLHTRLKELATRLIDGNTPEAPVDDEALYIDEMMAAAAIEAQQDLAAPQADSDAEEDLDWI